ALDLREGAADDPDEIDLLAYWRILVKRRWQVLGLLAAVVALALLHTLMTPPTYRSTVVMQISNQEQQVVPIGGMGAGMGGRWDPEFMQTQLELLKSRSLSERVAEDLDLDSAALDGLYQPSWLEQVKGLLRPAPKASAEQNVTAAESAAFLGSVTDVVRDGLSVEPILQSRLVQVNFDSQVPAFSARVANAIAEGFIAADLDRRVGASSYAKGFLEDQLRQTKSRLEDSERKLVAFAQKENLVSSAEGESLAGQNLGDLNSALATAQEQRIRAQARWSQAQAASGAALPADMLSNSIIRTLQQQRAELQGTYQQKLQVFKADYPEMLQLKGQLDDLNKQITSELRNIRASVKAEYDAAASQERLLLGQLSALRTQVLDVDSRSIDYNIIKREVDTNRQLYDSLLQRYKEVGVTGDVRTNNISIIDRAEVPEGRFAPSISRNLAIGLALGLLLGVLLAFLLEFLDDTLKTPEDIEQRLKLAVLGIIPKLKKQQPTDALHDPRSAFSEAYRSVRTALQFSTHDGVPKVLLVTSPGPGEGKSTSALMLARNFAQLGKRVLLVEADLRNPSLHKTLGLRAEAGLSNLLAGAVSLDAVVLGTDNVRLKVILAGPLPPNPAELLSGSRLISLLSVAAENYDQIIIDGPPIMGIADAPILANAVGATLMVIHSGKTRISTAQAALKRLLSVRAHVIGALITQYDTKAAGYGYSYEGYYAYGGTPRLTGK
ncbi:MAG: polysaccharide biosynthesis tyrosine autokinase, partial [Pseudoxanthomonas sp.]|nr:polysaccharide biosynthesis tyrosine autokinase [Pseudoxanthomonas sp.]